jgi:hypothetical protein
MVVSANVVGCGLFRGEELLPSFIADLSYSPGNRIPFWEELAPQADIRMQASL